MTKTITISDENHSMLLKMCGYLQERNGKRKTFDDALFWMFAEIGYETLFPQEQPKEVKHKKE